jgi:glucosamine kinase
VSEVWLFVDGGQTAMIAVAIDADGTIRGVGRGGAIRHHTEVGAPDAALVAVRHAVGDALSDLPEDARVVFVCLSLTGSEDFVVPAVRELVPDARVLVLESDALAALAAGTLGSGGIGLIAGTGTVAVARGRRGGPVRRGGWGWLLGDEGGGFWIGLEALRAAARHVDGTGPPTRLAETLPAALRQSDMHGVSELLSGQGLDRAAVAALTRDVDAIADDGDAVAIAILEAAAHHLAALVLATIEAAPFLEPDERALVAAGGVLRSRIVSGCLAQVLAASAPAFRLIEPSVPPVIGAYYLGLIEHGLPVSDTIHARVVEQSGALRLDEKGSGRGS